jgi:hypothetical protein
MGKCSLDVLNQQKISVRQFVLVLISHEIKDCIHVAQTNNIDVETVTGFTGDTKGIHLKNGRFSRKKFCVLIMKMFGGHTCRPI